MGIACRTRRHTGGAPIEELVAHIKAPHVPGRAVFCPDIAVEKQERNSYVGRGLGKQELPKHAPTLECAVKRREAEHAEHE